MKKTFLFIATFIFLTTIFALPINAQGGPTSRPTRGSCSNGVETALGCIPTDPAELAKWILSNAIYAGGGIAFLMSAWGGIGIVLAGGNPEAINKNKELITSAISGLLFIVFSIFILQLIGYDILRLPDFKP